jgi:CPA2 family monovalent cation:H+ antiporter-2
VYFGDASRKELLEGAGAARARAFVVTVDDSEAAWQVVYSIRANFPDAPILARAADARHARELLALGAVAVIPETVEASLQLAARLLEKLGFPDEAIAHKIADLRDRETARMKDGPEN